MRACKKYGYKEEDAAVPGLNNTVFTDATLTTVTNSFPPGGTKYNVQATTNPINDPCVNIANKVAMVANGNTIDENIRREEEEDVIDEIAIIPADELVTWMDDWKLYSLLDMDENRRLTHANLMSWYNTTQATNLGKIYDIDKKISILQLGSSLLNEAWMNQLFLTMYTHNNITANNDWEQAYLDVQSLQLNSIKNGLENVSETELETLTTIANACIYEKGLAVTQARAIYNTIHPGVHFNDYYICSPNANRNASAEVVYEGEFEKQDFQVSVHPIPANQSINFEYLCPLSEGKLYIYSTMGEVVKSVSLAKGLQKATIQVADMPSGIYTYKIVFANCGTSIGKFNIIH